MSQENEKVEISREEFDQIIFNALETEHSHTRSEEYKKKVREVIRILKDARKPSCNCGHGGCHKH